MCGKLFLGVDIGTTNVKALLVTPEGRIEASAGEELTTLYPEKDRIEQDPEMIWKQFRKAVRKVLSVQGIRPADVVGLSVDSNRCGMILADGEFRPLTNNMTWQDCRSTEQVRQFTAANPEIDVYRIAGEDALPQYSLYKMLWVREELPSIWEKARHVFFSPADYVLYRLLGRHVTCCGIAQSTHVYDINRQCYSETILSAAGIDRSMLPEVHAAVDMIGTLGAVSANELGLPEGVPVIAGMCDATASQMGSGSMKAGMFTISIGTCSAIRTFSEKPRYADDAFSQIRLCAPYGYVPTCTVNDSGSVLKWFRNEFCKDLMERAKEENRDVYDLITEEAAASVPGSRGILLLPHFSGSSYDFKDAEMFGAFVGIRSFHKRGDFARAILEGIAFSLRRVLEMFRRGGYEVDRTVLCGGGSNSPLWSQIIADVLGIRVMIPASGEAAALGSAMIVGIAEGLFRDPEDAADRMLSFRAVYDPKPENMDAYARSYALYQALSGVLCSYYGTHAEMIRGS